LLPYPASPVGAIGEELGPSSTTVTRYTRPLKALDQIRGQTRVPLGGIAKRRVNSGSVSSPELIDLLDAVHEASVHECHQNVRSSELFYWSGRLSAGCYVVPWQEPLLRR